MKQLIAVLLTVSLTGCSTAYRPKAPIPATVFSTPYLADLSSATLLKDYDAIPEGPLKVARRNAILWEVLWLTDQSYSNYETSFFTGQAFISTGADILNIALSSTAAVTGTAHLKSVLAVISGGVTGIRASYEKNFFDQATRETIVQVMRATRLTRLAEIQAGMSTCSTTGPCEANGGAGYSLEQGLLDATAYFDDGTIVGALIAINTSSSQQASSARASIRSMRMSGPH